MEENSQLNQTPVTPQVAPEIPTQANVVAENQPIQTSKKPFPVLTTVLGLALVIAVGIIIYLLVLKPTSVVETSDEIATPTVVGEVGDKTEESTAFDTNLNNDTNDDNVLNELSKLQSLENQIITEVQTSTIDSRYMIVASHPSEGGMTSADFYYRSGSNNIIWLGQTTNPPFDALCNDLDNWGIPADLALECTTALAIDAPVVQR